MRQSATALRDVEASIDAQVQARTRDLRRRSDLFRGAAAVARDLTGMHDEDELIHSVAEMICRRFDIDRAAVFLAPGGVGWSAETVLVLKAVFPLQGQTLQVGDLDLGAGPESAVWGAYREGEPRINHGMGSEIALPLRLQDHGDATGEPGIRPVSPTGGRVIGVLDIQSAEPGAFSREDLDVFGIVADQLALAIENASALNACRQAVQRLDMAYNTRLATMWRESIVPWQYRFDGVEVHRVGVGEAYGERVEPRPTRPPQPAEGDLVVPLSLRGQVIGTIALRRNAEVSGWSPQERALAASVGAQAGQALESALLLRESQMALLSEQAAERIASGMQRTPDVDKVIQTAMRDLQALFDLEAVEVRVDPASSAKGEAG